MGPEPGPEPAPEAPLKGVFMGAIRTPVGMALAQRPAHSKWVFHIVGLLEVWQEWQAPSTQIGDKLRKSQEGTRKRRRGPEN